MTKSYSPKLGEQLGGRLRQGMARKDLKNSDRDKNLAGTTAVASVMS